MSKHDQVGRDLGMTWRDIPLVQPGELILTVLIPLAAALKVVLVVQAAADGRPAGKVLANVLPLHALAAQLDDLGVLLGRPFGLLFGGRLGRVGSQAGVSLGRDGAEGGRVRGRLGGPVGGGGPRRRAEGAE